MANIAKQITPALIDGLGAGPNFVDCQRKSIGIFKKFWFLSWLGAFVLVLAQADSNGQTPDQAQSHVPQSADTNPVEIKKQKFKFKKNGAIVYRKFDDFDLTCDVYVPDGKGTFPAILTVHGGAWRQGSKIMMLRHAWQMARAGYVVVAINYRHAPTHPFPAQIDDCKHAVRWMRTTGAKYKIDPDRIGAFGYSAGGHLVALLGVTDAGDRLEGTIEPGTEGVDSRVKAVVAGGAPCEFSWVGQYSPMLKYWLGQTKAENPEPYRRASPTSYVTQDDPPFYFFHGSYDLLVPESSSKQLHQRLQNAGIFSKHVTAKGFGHLGTFSELTWMKQGIEFFDDHLKPKNNLKKTDRELAPKTSDR